MKATAALLVTAVLLLAGCVYESPVTAEHTIPIDRSVLGVWRSVPEKGKEPGDVRMMVLRYSDTEYLVHYPAGKDGLYYRGYPVQVGKVSCVQLEVIGTEDGPLDKDAKELFCVVSYSLANGELEVKVLNTDLVGKELKNSEALRGAFLEYQGDKDLFTGPARFGRVKD